MKAPEIIYRKYGEKLGLKHLNPNNLERIASFLTLGDISNLSLLSQSFNQKMKSPLLESIWIMNTYSTFVSKSGYTGIRNLNLVRIDKMLKDMHYETEALILKCKQE